MSNLSNNTSELQSLLAAINNLPPATGDFPNGTRWSKTAVSTPIKSVYYSGDKWVAGGDNGIFYSTDGIVWNSSNISAATTAVYNHKGTWVANVSDAIYYSADAKTWTSAGVSGTSLENFYSANGQVLIGCTNARLTSSDGITWTSTSQSNGLIKVWSHANGLYVGGGGKGLRYSEDGVNWNASNVGSGTFYTIEYFKSVWVAGGNMGLFYSTDGRSWTKVSNAPTMTTPKCATDSIILAAASNADNGIYYSSDGITWTQSNVTDTRAVNIEYGNGVYVAYNGLGVGLYYSTDGMTWSATSTTEGCYTMYHARILGYGNGIWVAASNSGLYYSVALVPSDSAHVEVEVEEKDVNFYDYDGTLLYSYTIAEAQALTELPPGPEHEGLVFQEWNWSLEDVKSLDHIADIGASMITDDGKTRIYLHNDYGEPVNADLWWRQSVSEGVEIFSEGLFELETISGTGAVSKNITVPPGHSMIELSVNSGTLILGAGHNLETVINGSAAALQLIVKVELGANVDSIGAGTFSGHRRLQTIAVPSGLGVGHKTFQDCVSLQAAILNNNKDVSSQYVFNNCYRLRVISFRKTIEEISGGFMYGGLSECYSLNRLILPEGPKATATYTAEYCGSITDVYFPSTFTSLNGSALRDCSSLRKVVFAGAITTISTNMFRNAGVAEFYDFTKCTAVPTLENTSAFSGIPADCEIRVPAVLYDEWIAATNWSTYTTNIVGKTN